MEELIFFGILILFSILDGIARKKRQQGGGAEIPTPEEWDLEEEEEAWGDGDLATYDDDPSYDDRARDPDGDGIPGQPLPRYTQPYGSRTESRDPARGSERMIPSDVWDEIESLARGEASRPSPSPSESRPSTETSPDPGRMQETEIGTGGRASTAPIRSTEHRVHRSHADYGTDPSSRAPSVFMGARAEPGVKRRGVRPMLSGPAALRRAVLMREILGTPVGLRGDPWGEGR